MQIPEKKFSWVKCRDTCAGTDMSTSPGPRAVIETNNCLRGSFSLRCDSVETQLVCGNSLVLNTALWVQHFVHVLHMWCSPVAKFFYAFQPSSTPSVRRLTCVYCNQYRKANENIYKRQNYWVTYFKIVSFKDYSHFKLQKVKTISQGFEVHALPWISTHYSSVCPENCFLTTFRKSSSGTIWQWENSHVFNKIDTSTSIPPTFLSRK